jgi:peptidoglycan/LPS O-acetylase OafA/YrhL
MWFGIPTPDRQLYPNWPSAIGFGGAFSLGWFWHRTTTRLQSLVRYAPWYLLFAIIGSALSLQIAGGTPSLTIADKTLNTAAYALLYSLSAWCWVAAVMGIGLRWLNQPNASLRYLADASYSIYLMHLPLVMLLQIVVRDWSLVWWLKLPLTFTVAMIVLLLSYHGLVRRSWIGVMLNGKRKH